MSWWDDIHHDPIINDDVNIGDKREEARSREHDEIIRDTLKSRRGSGLTFGKKNKGKKNASTNTKQ
jgi:hypothetical protein